MGSPSFPHWGLGGEGLPVGTDPRVCGGSGASCRQPGRQPAPSPHWVLRLRLLSWRRGETANLRAFSRELKPMTGRTRLGTVTPPPPPLQHNALLTIPLGVRGETEAHGQRWPAQGHTARGVAAGGGGW